MTKEQLLEKANDLPLAPGVYLMMDASGKVIYVGKAKKLKNRVSQYFQLGTGHNEKTRRMVSQVDHFDTIFVSSEFEALILENSLIKQHQPHYNILLKDDKGYPFVRLSHGPYPRFTLANKTADDGARYFGPYASSNSVRTTLDLVNKLFEEERTKVSQTCPLVLQSTRPGFFLLCSHSWEGLRESWIKGSSDGRTMYMGRTVGL